MKKLKMFPGWPMEVAVPELVMLRNENEPDRTEEWSVFVKWQRSVHNRRLRNLIARCNSDPNLALCEWHKTLYHPRRHGVYLLPHLLYEIINLPVRQVYIAADKLYRIDPEQDGIHGRVTARLI